jgi:methionyl-tRNA formyltransferase
MVVAFFGTPRFAVPTLRQLIASRHRVAGVVTQPDRPRGRGQRVSDSPVKSVAIEHGLPVLQPDRLLDPEFVETFGSWKPDLGVVVAYGKLIPDAVLRLPRLGMINLHASLLPKYRGAAPVHRAIIDGQQETGVTIMRVAKALDAGNMLAKARRPIGQDESSDEVESDLAVLGAPLLVGVVDRMERGDIVEESQDGSASTYAAKLTKEEGLIDWSATAAAIHNRVRGLHPWPHAYTYLEGARLIVLKTRVSDERTGHRPGTIVHAGGETLAVAAGDGKLVVIEALQPEGRKAMRVREFLAGRALGEGARFGSP